MKVRRIAGRGWGAWRRAPLASCSWMVALCIWVAGVPQAWAGRHEVWYPGRTVTVRLKVGQTTAVVLPGAPVSIQNPDEGRINVEVQKDHLLIKALDEFDGRMFVQDKAGTVYGLALETVDAREDDIVRIHGDEDALTVGPSLEHPGRPLVDLFLAMYRGEEKAGYEVSDGGARVVYADDEILMRLVKSYEGVTMIGYVVKIENISAQPVHLHPKQFQRKGALMGMVAASIRDAYLAPRSPSGSIESEMGMARETKGYLVIHSDYAKGLRRKQAEEKGLRTRKDG